METWLLIGCRLCDVTMFLQKMLFYAVILRNFGKLVSYYWFSSANTPFQLSIIKSRRWDVSFNPRPAGGGRLNAPPSGFSRIAKKRRRAAPPGFHPPYPPSFPQLLWKFRPKAMWGQVTRSGQVTQLQNNFPIAPRLQCFRESYETFGIWWGHQCLQNVYLGFLISVTSGQVIFATSPL